MRRLLIITAACAMVFMVAPASAAPTMCKNVGYDNNEPNPTGCVIGTSSGCNANLTAICTIQRKITAPTAGTYDAEFSVGPFPGTGTWPGDCRGVATTLDPTKIQDKCLPLNPSAVQGYASRAANCWQTFNPQTKPATTCIESEPDVNKYPLGYAAVRRSNLARTARCLYLTDDRTGQDQNTGKIGYVFQAQIPAGSTKDSSFPNWSGKYWKLEAVNNPTADFDMYFYTTLGGCSNSPLLNEEPQQPSDDVRDSTFSKPGNEKGRIPSCEEQRPPTDGCKASNTTYWYSIIVTMYTGSDATFKLTFCPTQTGCS